MEVKGMFKAPFIHAEQRVYEGLNVEALTALKQLETEGKFFNVFSAAAAQDVVLPPATEILDGMLWRTTIVNSGAANLTVKTFDSETPATLRVINPGEAFEFTLIDNVNDAGVWRTKFHSPDETSKFPFSFNATDDWIPVGNTWTITVPSTVHQLGIDVNVNVYELSGGVFYAKIMEDVSVNADGDVTIVVSSNKRFAGKLIIN